MLKRRTLTPCSASRTTFSAPFLTVLFSLVCITALFVSVGRRFFLEQDMPFDPGWAKHSVATITATRDNAFYWDNRGPFPVNEFASMLDSWLRDAEQPSVLICADDTARFGTAIALLGEVRARGIGSVTLDTRTRTPPFRVAAK